MRDTPGRTLVVMRHARPETQAASDRVRRLTPTGRRDAESVGEWLAQTGVRPDLVLVSPAVRAVTTAELAIRALDSEPSPRLQVVDDLYGADPDRLLDEIRVRGRDASCVMVVGHNPTVSELAQVLQSEPAAAHAAHLPPAGVAVLETPVAWSELAAHQARLVRTHLPTASAAGD